MVSPEHRRQIGLNVVARLEEAGLPIELLARIAEIKGDAFLSTNWNSVRIQLMHAGREKRLIPPRPTGWGTCVAQASWDRAYNPK